VKSKGHVRDRAEMVPKDKFRREGGEFGGGRTKSWQKDGVKKIGKKRYSDRGNKGTGLDAQESSI